MSSKNDSRNGSTGGVVLVLEIVSRSKAQTGSSVRSGTCASASGGPRQSLFNGTWVACATYNLVAIKVNSLHESDREYLFELARSLGHGAQTIYTGNPVKINARVQRFLEKRLVARRHLDQDGIEILMDPEIRDIILDMRNANEKAAAPPRAFLMTGPVGQA